MIAFLNISQIIVSVLLVGAILLQAKGKGFARSQSAVSFTRRGAERLVFRATFVLVALFIIISLVQLLVA